MAPNAQPATMTATYAAIPTIQAEGATTLSEAVINAEEGPQEEEEVEEEEEEDSSEATSPEETDYQAACDACGWTAVEGAKLIECCYCADRYCMNELCTSGSGMVPKYKWYCYDCRRCWGLSVSIEDFEKNRHNLRLRQWESATGDVASRHNPTFQEQRRMVERRDFLQRMIEHRMSREMMWELPSVQAHSRRTDC